jgi:hypothetical protein
VLVNGDDVPLPGAALAEPAQERTSPSYPDDDRLGVGLGLDAEALRDLGLQVPMQRVLPPFERIGCLSRGAFLSGGGTLCMANRPILVVLTQDPHC